MLFCSSLSWAADGKTGHDERKLFKPRAHSDRKEGILDGNRISTIFYNYGAIGDWQNRRRESGIYPKGANGHSYFAEFTPIAGAEVTDNWGQRRHIFSDGAASTSVADNRPTGGFYAFEPLPGYADPDQDFIAISDAQDNDGDGKPDSWPWRWPDKPDWFNPKTGAPLWNGQYGAYPRADQETYYKMNDYYNDEFNFFPSSEDTLMRGLGLEVAVRGYQWAHPAAEDIIIWTYWITNTGTTNYEKVVFGMYGDADVGDDGDQRDDDAFFNKKEDIVYQWDHDNRGAWGGPPAYFGFRYLESPGDPLNGIDDDEDGMTDESQSDGIDNDGDWNPELDDIGLDGLGPKDMGYPGPDIDGTEGNGIPDADYSKGVAEPNFEMSDNSESDQLGLTSFNAAAWPGITLDNDETIWAKTVPGNFDDIQQTVDLTFMYATAYFELPGRGDPNSQRKFAIALLFGEDFDDLLRNAKTMQNIYDADYNFAKPPEKPNVVAVPGDHKVTLYWDKRAEEATRDPIYGYDFEGYMIFRSTDAGFSESYIITNAYGNKQFDKPIAQFDRINGLKGPHPVGQDGLQMNMGSDSGLQYNWTDTTVENGQTYYYAVCSYDQGYDVDFYERGISELADLLPIAPSVSSKRIRTDVRGKVIATDINTVEVTPDAPAAGYVEPPLMSNDRRNNMVRHISGTGTGYIEVSPLDPLKVPDGVTFKLTFDDSTFSTEEKDSVVFSLLDERILTEKFSTDSVGILLQHQNIKPSSVVVTDPNTGETFEPEVDFQINYAAGTIRILPDSRMMDGQEYQISYQYFPIFNSPYVHGEDFNPYFDGLRVVVHNDPLDPDTARTSDTRSRWLTGDLLQEAAETYNVPFDPDRPVCNYRGIVSRYPSGGVKVPYDFDIVVYDQTFKNQYTRNKPTNFLVFNTTTGDTAVFQFQDADRNGKLSSQDAIIPITYVRNRPKGSWQIKFWAPEDSLVIELRDSTYTDSLGNLVTVTDTVVVDRIPRAITPKAGDVFHVSILKPFKSKDVFEFTTQAAYVDKQVARSDSALDRIAVVPNPYVVTADWEPQHVFKSGRGERKIDFIHLPQKCTIKIFTVRGYLVATIEHDSPMDDGSESWNLLSKDGMEIAYGIYIYHVDAPGIGQKIGKFGVIK